MPSPTPDAGRPDTGKPASSRHRPVFGRFPARIDWDLAPERLTAGDVSMLQPDSAAAIRRIAGQSEVVRLAVAFRLDPILLVIGLLAHLHATSNRSAARIARAIFKGEPARELLELARQWPI